MKFPRLFQLSSFTHAFTRNCSFFSPQLCAQLHELHIVYFFNSWTVWTSVAMAFLLALFVIESAALEVARSSPGGQVPWPTGPTGCEEMGPAKERAMKFLEENMPPWDVINKGTLKPGVRIKLRCCQVLFSFFFRHFPIWSHLLVNCIDITLWRLEALGGLQAQLLLFVDCYEICHHFFWFDVSNSVFYFPKIFDF